MSNTDSFIEEVTEEVRRDRLFALLKRWGWIGGVAVLLIVGGAAWNEYRKAQERNLAQGFGDQVLESLEGDYTGAALGGIEAETPGQRAIAGHIAAARALSEGDTAAGVAELQDVVQVEDAARIYRELAAFKAALAAAPDTAAEERIARFDALSTPGNPMRVLAQEQKALVLIDTGDAEAAIEILKRLVEDAEATPGLQRRASELLVALGADLDNTADAG